MQIHHRPLQASRGAFVRPLVLGLSSVFAVGAWAQDEPSPYYIGVTQGFTHDTNIYGSSTNQISDTYSSTGLRGGLDQTIGRQRVYANANVRYNKYRNESVLDNTSYGVAAGWDWATIEQLSGNVSATANQSLANLDSTPGLTQSSAREKNTLKTDQLSTSVTWGGAGALSLQGAYAHSRVDYSAVAYAGLKSSADSASASVFYRVGPQLKLGTALRFVRTESPNAVPLSATNTDTSNTANIRNLDLTADWRPTAQTGFDSRLSWTRQTNSHQDLSDLDFSGLTGRLAVRYAATGKTTLNASLSRDVGTNAAFYNNPNTTTSSGQPTSDLTRNSQTTDTFALGAHYAATAKIGVDLGASYRRAKVVYDDSAAAADVKDNIRSLSLGAEYQVARSWQLGCKLSRSLRRVTGTTSYAYSDGSIGCTAQLTLR